MTNDKVQTQIRKNVVLVFKHLDFICYLDFDIWVYLELRGASQKGNPYEQG